MENKLLLENDIDKFNQYGLPEGARTSTCPKCSKHRNKKHEKCLMLDWESGLGTCQHCDARIQLHTYKRKGSFKKEYSVPVSDFEPINDKVVGWFKERGISKSTLETLNVTQGVSWMPNVNAEVNTIQFNYFLEGKLVNIKYRDGNKNFKLYKGAEKIFYNIDSVVDSDTIIICEGEVDALSIHESGHTNVVSVPNGANSGRINLDYLDNCFEAFEDKSIILVVDQDEPGQALEQEFIRRLGANSCSTVDLGECKDANEFLVNYGADSLYDTISNPIPCPLENVVTVKDVENEIEEFVNNGFKPGFQTGVQSFDDIFSTYTGQFITVTGIPSSGKSDFVDQMVMGYNINYGWKTAYVSPENKPNFLHMHKLIRKFGNWMPKKDDVGGARWNKIINHINDNCFFVEMEKYDLDKVLEKGAELVKRRGIKCFVIDPFNKVNMKGKGSLSIPDYTQEYLQKIDNFSRKYNVLTIIVAHPTKQYKNKVTGIIDEPTMYDIKGGGEWYDSSYHGLLVHRDYTAKTVKIKVLKVKFQNLGENGAETILKWDQVSGLYKETTEISDSGLPF